MQAHFPPIDRIARDAHSARERGLREPDRRPRGEPARHAYAKIERPEPSLGELRPLFVELPRSRQQRGLLNLDIF
jgi:hypothetical protein